MNDLISRQAAIDALKEHRALYCDNTPDTFSKLSYAEKSRVDELDTAIATLVNLPSAEEPFKLPEIYVADGYDTVAGEDGNVGFGVYVPDENQIYVAGDVEDEIRARALLHEICHWVQAVCGRPFDEDEANEFSNIVYDALPPEQPERKRGKWIVYKAPDKQHCGLVKCPFCGEDMIAEADEYNFCPNCGADMRGEQDETN